MMSKNDTEVDPDPTTLDVAHKFVGLRGQGSAIKYPLQIGEVDLLDAVHSTSATMSIGPVKPNPGLQTEVCPVLASVMGTASLLQKGRLLTTFSYWAITTRCAARCGQALTSFSVS